MCAFLNADEMILEGNHLGSQEFDSSGNLSSLPLGFFLATESEHVGGSTTKIDFGGRTLFSFFWLREIARKMRAPLKKGIVLEHNGVAMMGGKAWASICGMAE